MSAPATQTAPTLPIRRKPRSDAEADLAQQAAWRQLWRILLTPKPPSKPTESR